MWLPSFSSDAVVGLPLMLLMLALQGPSSAWALTVRPTAVKRPLSTSVRVSVRATKRLYKSSRPSSQCWASRDSLFLVDLLKTATSKGRSFVTETVPSTFGLLSVPQRLLLVGAATFVVFLLPRFMVMRRRRKRDEKSSNGTATEVKSNLTEDLPSRGRDLKSLPSSEATLIADDIPPLPLSHTDVGAQPMPFKNYSATAPDVRTRSARSGTNNYGYLQRFRSSAMALSSLANTMSSANNNLCVEEQPLLLDLNTLVGDLGTFLSLPERDLPLEEETTPPPPPSV